MFIEAERAEAIAEGRKRFLSVYQGRAICFMPYQSGERYVSTHFVPDLNRSVICEGETQCRYHDRKEVCKLHIAALVFRNAFAYSQREGGAVPKVTHYVDLLWTWKIVELTEACFIKYKEGRDYGTLASIARKPGRVNGEVEFNWLDGKTLVDFPSPPEAVEQLLPAVIRGAFYPAAKVVGLDNPPAGRIKHKRPYPTL